MLLTAPAMARLQAAEWVRDKTPLLKNFTNMYNPCVVETGGEHPYKMWFFGWSTSHANQGLGMAGCDMIFHARSKDLVHWEVYSGDGTWDASMTPSKWKPVLHASGKWYEAWHVGDPSVVFKDGKYYLAYSSTSKPFGEVPGYPSTMVQCVMGAVSEDGIHWEKSESPLLIRQGDSAPPPAEPGRIGDFHRPCLRWEKDRWLLWFDYWLPGQGVCMGCAENTGDFLATGGFKLLRDLSDPLLVNWPNPEIIKIGNEYHSFADPADYPVDASLPEGAKIWMTRQIREAVSPDGVHWRKLDYISPDADAPALHVPQALITQKDGRPWLYLFYSTQIGYGKDAKVYDYQYDRIRAMKRPIEAAGN